MSQSKNKKPSLRYDRQNFKFQEASDRFFFGTYCDSVAIRSEFNCSLKQPTGTPMNACVESRAVPDASVAPKGAAQEDPAFLDIADIGMLDTRHHVETLRGEFSACRSLSVEVTLAAVRQMLERIAERQGNLLGMRDVDAVLLAILRTR
jgi:hypothetical protein